MKKLILVVISAFMLAGTASFANDGSAAEAEKLFAKMQMKEMYEKTVEKMLSVQIQRNPSLVPYKGVMMRFLNKYMSFDSLKPDLVKIYSNTFTTNELKELNKFYSTKTGQKAIEVMPSLAAQGAELGARRVQDHIQELRSMLEAEKQRIQQQQQQ